MARTGRPTEYSQDVPKKATAYLKKCVDKFDRVVEMANEEKGYEKYRNRLVVRLPSVAGLALHLGVARSTVYEWAAKYAEFSDILERILAEQEQRLIQNGLSGAYNAHIAKLALGKHGYKEEKDVTSGGKPIGRVLDELDD